MKTCTKCGGEFPATTEYFYRDKTKEGGLASNCKVCRASQNKEYKSKNKERISKVGSLYYEENKEIISVKYSEYYLKNRDKLLEYQKKYISENSEKVRNRQMKWREKNKDALREKKRIYAAANAEKRKEYRKTYAKENAEVIKKNKKKDGLSKLKYRSKYTTKLKAYEEIRKSKCGKYAEIKCAYCGKWGAPTNSQCQRRINAINGKALGEQRIYCDNSESGKGCREACPTYKQRVYPKGFKPATSREVDPLTRQLCFERDGYECQRCGVSVDEAQLHRHHIVGVTHSPMEQNDVKNTITLCKKCHKELHKQPGCTYVDYKCA